MKRRYRKRKVTRTWRVVPARTTPKRKPLGRAPRILRAYALTYTGKAPASRSSTFITTLNERLDGTGYQVTPALIQAWERAYVQPEDNLLRSLALCSTPLSWTWLLAHDLLASKYPAAYHPQGVIGHKILQTDDQP
jgi:hypothetical protein